jgi:hypothetical protein
VIAKYFSNPGSVQKLGVEGVECDAPMSGGRGGGGGDTKYPPHHSPDSSFPHEDGRRTPEGSSIFSVVWRRSSHGRLPGWWRLGNTLGSCGSRGTCLHSGELINAHLQHTFVGYGLTRSKGPNPVTKRSNGDSLT